jgi:hypothetical protein
MSALGHPSTAIQPTRFRWHLHRNPLRTRAQVCHEAFLAFVALALCALPALGALAGRAEYTDAAADRHAAMAANRPVTAVLQETIYSVGGIYRGSTDTTALVSWTAADGAARVGRAQVQTVGDKGEPVTIWLNPAGNPTTAPTTEERLVLDAVGVGILAVLAGAGVLLVLFAAEHTVFTRIRARAWTRAWARTAPLWEKTR